MGLAEGGATEDGSETGGGWHFGLCVCVCMYRGKQGSGNGERTKRREFIREGKMRGRRGVGCGVR